LGVGANHNTDCFHNTGLPSEKVFMLPDKTRIRASKKMRLKHNLQPEASKMNIVQNLHSTLISVPKLADVDYIEVFDKKEARIYDAMTTILSASKDPILVAPCCQDTGLWKHNLDYEVLGHKYPDQFIADVDKANAIFDLPNKQQSLLYHHASVGFPPKETFLAAVRAGHCATWPGLTSILIHKHFPDSDKTQKGHMKGQQKGVRLTKVLAPVTIKVEPGTANPPPLTITKHYDIFFVVYKLLDTVHTDQTDPFPVMSQQGYWYIMVGIHLDANYIICKLMKNQTKGKIIMAYQKMVDRMKLLALGLKHDRLDNKCLAALKACIAKNRMTHELVPLDCHHCNIAKRAIQMFKNHFVSILSRVDDRFPLSLWCHLVRPVELTVNLLQQSNVAPKVSAYAHVHGQHNYIKHPFAPLGCAVMAHVKLKNRQSWDIHADTGFNIGMAMEHHQCFHIYIVKTRATRISDTVFFKHQHITNPQVTPKTLIIKAALDLTSALKGTISCYGKTAEALQKFSKLFTKIAVAKSELAKAKKQRSNLQNHPNACRAVPLPRVAERPPTPASPLPKVPKEIVEADCRVTLMPTKTVKGEMP
jgi:hypothetical protein